MFSNKGRDPAGRRRVHRLATYCDVFSDGLLEQCAHGLWTDADWGSGGHGWLQDGRQRSQTEVGQPRPRLGGAQEHGRKTRLEAFGARPTMYESRPGMGQAGWGAQWSTRCMAVGYEGRTCGWVRFGKSKIRFGPDQKAAVKHKIEMIRKQILIANCINILE